MTTPQKENTPPLSVAIFDLDGTLIDSMGVWEKIDRAFLASRNLPVPQDYLQQVNGMGFLQTAQYTIERFALPDTPAQLMAEWTEMAAYEYEHNIPLKEGVRFLLEHLKAKGFRLAVATASPKRFYLPVLQRNGIADLFDCLCSTDEVGAGKHDPKIFTYVAQKLQKPPAACLVFEDLLLAVQTARQAGMRTCGVYDATSAAQQQQLMQVCDWYLPSFVQWKEQLPFLL